MVGSRFKQRDLTGRISQLLLLVQRVTYPPNNARLIMG